MRLPYLKRLFFVITLRRMRVLSNLPFYLVFVAGFYLFEKTNLLKQLHQAIQYFTANQNMIWVTGFGLGLLLLLISCPLSSLIHKKNEL
jgi:hypothetical protein